MTRLILFLLFCFMLLACKKEEETNTNKTTAIFDKLYIRLDSFKRLQGGYNYEGWLMLKGTPVSTGKFNLDPENLNVYDTLNKPHGYIANVLFVFKQDISTADEFFITMEPKGDMDLIPTGIKIVFGKIDSLKSKAEALNSDAIGLDFKLSTGSYIIGTRSTIPVDKFPFGIWFAKRVKGEEDILTGLNLPAITQNASWTYEAWLIYKTVPTDEYFKIGRFIKPDAPDSSKLSPLAPNQVPIPVPGEDFIYDDTLKLNNGSYKLLITLEPRIDNEKNSPFFIKLFENNIPSIDGMKFEDTTLTLKSLNNLYLPKAVIRISN